jgi:hypothetical protein
MKKKLLKRRESTKIMNFPESRHKFLGFSHKWITFTIGMMFLFHIAVEIIPYILVFQRNFLHSFTLTRLLLESITFIIAYLFLFHYLDTRVGNFLLIPALFLSGETIFHIFKRMSDFTLALAFWGFITLVAMVAVLFALIRIALIPKTIQTTELVGLKKLIFVVKNRMRHARVYSPLLAVLVLIFLPLTLIISDQSFGIPITIEPKDYQIEIRVWGHYTPEYYQTHPHGTEILDQYNKHNVIIQNCIFSLRDADGNLESFSPTIHPSDENKTATALIWFRDNYPNIRFQYYAYGLGYNSCGNYEGSLYTAPMLKRFVDVCRNYSLPNVVGVYTDWEGPAEGAPKYANTSRNGWHQALWTDAMAYARTYFPTWIFSCCHPESTMWDRVDDDDDLQFYQRYNIFMPMWDDYGPMVYRSCNPKDKEQRDYDGSWKIYANAKALVEGTLQGDYKKASMWIGCTGCGPYNNETIVYEHGKPMDFGEGKGFDAFARDVLILKHFRIPSFSIFHGIEVFEPGQDLNGFFYQYGYNALDRLNEVINGGDSTKSFTIWSEGDWSPKADLTLDFILDYNRITFTAIMAIYIGFGLLLVKIKDTQTPKTAKKATSTDLQ